MAASAGVLITAALETVGHKAQSLVLDQLGSMINGLGMLVFLIAATFTVFLFVIREQKENHLWFIVGPALFLFLTQSRTVSAGAEWQFGDFRGEQREVQEIVGENVNARVSWFFAFYNRIVSGLVQDLAAVFSNDELTTQIKFMNRQRIMDLVFRSEIASPGLMALVKEGIQGECGVWMDSTRKIALGNRDMSYRSSSEYKNALSSYEQLSKNKVHRLNTLSPAYDYSRELWPAMRAFAPLNADGTTGAVSGVDGFVNTYCQGKPELKQAFNADALETLNGPLSCEHIWCLSAFGLHSEAVQLLTQATESTVGSSDAAKGMTAAQKQAAIREILSDIALKLQPHPDSLAVLPGTNYVVQTDISIIPVVIGGILLRKEMMRDPNGALLSNFGEKAGLRRNNFNFNMDMTDEQLQVTTERMQQTIQSTAMRYELFTLAMMLPYVQGVLLYGLAMFFPFFCILVLIPGRAGALFSWMRLWAWLKAWDVGWIAVMSIDEVLWDLMPHSAEYQPLVDANHAPITVLEAAFNNDPAYSLTSYYLLLSILISGVPLITAQLMLRGEGRFLTMLLEGVMKLSQAVGTKAGDWVAMDKTLQSDFIKHQAEINYAMGRAAAQQAPNQAQDVRNQLSQNIQAVNAQGEAEKQYGAWGMVAGGAGLLFSMTPVGRGVRALQLMSSAAAIGGASMYNAGVENQRAANTAKTQQNNFDMQLYVLESNRDKTRRYANALRAATANGRVMPFYMNTTGEGSVANYMVANQKLLNLQGRTNAQAAGQTFGGVRSVVRAPAQAAVAAAMSAATSSTPAPTPTNGGGTK